MAPFSLPPSLAFPPPTDRPSSALFPLKLRALSISVAVVVGGGGVAVEGDSEGDADVNAQAAVSLQRGVEVERGPFRPLLCRRRVVRCLFRGRWPSTSKKA